MVLAVSALAAVFALQDTYLMMGSQGTVLPEASSPLELTVVGHEFRDGNGDKVFLRGVGIIHQHNDVRGWWSGPGEPFSEGRWETDLTLLTQRIDDNLAAIKLWEGNVIRVFLAVNWWWIDTINPYQRYGEGPNLDMSYRNYFELLVQRAQLQGIYVIFCPYELVSYQEDYVGFGGLPVPNGPDSRGKSVLDAIYSGDSTYIEPMRRWWQSVTGRLGNYPNVIFEMWNEPDDVDKTDWFNYQIEMYKTMRQTTNNVILFAWRECAIPRWQEELTWIPDLHNQLRSSLASEPFNVGYVFHTYRYEHNLDWGTSYSVVLDQLTAPNWIQQTRSASVDVPVICSETGMGLDASNLNDEMGWWDGLLRSFNELSIGYIACYWMPADAGWRPEQGLLTANSTNYWPAGQPSPDPSSSGTIFLNNKP